MEAGAGAVSGFEPPVSSPYGVGAGTRLSAVGDGGIVHLHEKCKAMELWSSWCRVPRGARNCLPHGMLLTRRNSSRRMSCSLVLAKCRVCEAPKSAVPWDVVDAEGLEQSLELPQRVGDCGRMIVLRFGEDDLGHAVVLMMRCRGLVEAACTMQCRSR